MNTEQGQQLLEGSLARQFNEGGTAINKTLRQWYAGMAMQGIVTGAPNIIGHEGTLDNIYSAWAVCAFRCADAMLAAERLDAAGGK